MITKFKVGDRVCLIHHQQLAYGIINSVHEEDEVVAVLLAGNTVVCRDISSVMTRMPSIFPGTDIKAEIRQACRDAVKEIFSAPTVGIVNGKIEELS
mgnify:CR=1 FL=1